MHIIINLVIDCDFSRLWVGGICWYLGDGLTHSRGFGVAFRIYFCWRYAPNSCWPNLWGAWGCLIFKIALQPAGGSGLQGKVLLGHKERFFFRKGKVLFSKKEPFLLAKRKGSFGKKERFLWKQGKVLFTFFHTGKVPLFKSYFCKEPFRLSKGTFPDSRTAEKKIQKMKQRMRDGGRVVQTRKHSRTECRGRVLPGRTVTPEWVLTRLKLRVSELGLPIF